MFDNFEEITPVANELAIQNSCDTYSCNKRIPKEMELKTMLFSPIILMFAFILVNIAIEAFASLFMTIISIANIAIAHIYLKKHDYSFSRKHQRILGILIAFCFAYSYTANYFICFLVTVFEILGSSYYIFSVCHDNCLEDYTLFYQFKAALFHYPIAESYRTEDALKGLFSKIGAAKNMINAISGIIISVPITIVVALLLISADEGVGKFLGSIFNVEHFDFASLILKLVLTAMFGTTFFAMLVNNSDKTIPEYVTNEKTVEILDKKKKSPLVTLCFSVVPICILYIIFFVSQASYLLGAFTGSLPKNFSYSGYARRGFFELCFIAIINLFIIIKLNLSVKDYSNTHKAVRFFGVFFCLSTLFIIATALRKMFLYIEHFGLTQLRLYTSWFMLFLAVIFILAMVWTCQRNRSLRIFHISLITFVIFFGIFVFAKPDAIIAKYNISMFENQTHNFLDLDALLDLSADASPYISEYTDDATVRKLLTAKLCDYSDFNLSVYLAKSKL